MARKNRTLTTAFDTLPKEEEVVKTAQEATEEVAEPSEGQSLQVGGSARDELLKEREERRRKKNERVEDTHKRATFLFRKDLSERLDKLVKSDKDITKTMFINRAIESLLEDMED